MTNNAATEENRATVNGIAVMFEGAGKGLAPMAIATAFAWSLSIWGGVGRFASFLLLSGLYAMAVALVIYLPAEIENQVVSQGASMAEISEDAAVLGAVHAERSDFCATQIGAIKMAD